MKLQTNKKESRNGEELGREIRNFLSKYIVLGLTVENPKLDARKTGQIWDREWHFWVICPNLSFCPFIQPRQFFICRNISGEYDADRKGRGMPCMGPGGNIKQFPGRLEINCSTHRRWQMQRIQMESRKMTQGIWHIKFATAQYCVLVGTSRWQPSSQKLKPQHAGTMTFCHPNRVSAFQVLFSKLGEFL